MHIYYSLQIKNEIRGLKKYINYEIFNFIAIHMDSEIVILIFHFWILHLILIVIFNLKSQKILLARYLSKYPLVVDGLPLKLRFKVKVPKLSKLRKYSNVNRLHKDVLGFPYFNFKNNQHNLVWLNGFKILKYTR